MQSKLLVVLLALLPACGGNPGTGASDATSAGSGTGGSGGAGAGTAGTGGAGTSSSSSGTPCVYPPVNNPAGCPPAYSNTYSFQPCTMPGLDCWYPGVGDIGADGCNAAALLECTSMFSDGGAAEWRAAQ